MPKPDQAEASCKRQALTRPIAPRTDASTEQTNHLLSMLCALFVRSGRPSASQHDATQMLRNVTQIGKNRPVTHFLGDPADPHRPQPAWPLGHLSENPC
jgi:hypothetical protein